MFGGTLDGALQGGHYKLTLSAAKMYVINSGLLGNINRRCSKVFLAGTSSNLRGVVEIDEFAVLPLPYFRKFQK